MSEPYRACRQAYSWCGGPDAEGIQCSACVMLAAHERMISDVDESRVHRKDE